MLKTFIIALAGFLFFLIFHVIYFRRSLPTARFFAMVRIYICTAVLLPFAYLSTPDDLGFIPASFQPCGHALGILNTLLVSTFLFMAYSMFYFLVDRGFSGRIMIEIEQSPSCCLARDEIPKLYSLEMVLERRLGEMISIGRVVRNGERYCNTAAGSRAAKLFLFVKEFLRLGPGG